MTREEAIEYLNTLYMALAVFPNQQISLGNVDEMKESVSMAIKALEQEPSREFEDYENEIEDLHNRLDIAEYDKERLREEVTNLEAKIKALEQEPCEDAISRQYLIEKATNWEKHFHDSERYVSLTDIQNAPPVKPQEPILDNIKREVFNACSDNYHIPVYKLDCDEIFEIIDKYRGEE